MPVFAAPQAFLLLLGAAPLVALYMLKVRRRRVSVPSLMLWQAVVRNERRARSWDRLRQHLLLWLQLLALLLLAMALARPSLPGRVRLGRTVVWVLDATASMGAADRFADAQAAIAGQIARLDALDEGALVIAAAQTRVAMPFTRDQTALRVALGAVAPTESPGELGESIEVAVSLCRGRPGCTVVAATDGSDPSAAVAQARHPDVQVLAYGRDLPNVGITAIDLRRAPTRELEPELFVTLRRFGGADGAVPLEVTLDGQLIASVALTVPSDRPAGRIFRLGPDQRSGALEVRVPPGDGLAADDVARLWLDPPRVRRVRCEGCSALTARALAVDERFAVEVGGEGPVDLLVFEEQPVPAAPIAPFLALGAPSLGGVPAAPAVPWPVVTDWDRRHPALRSVDPSAIAIAEAAPAPPDQRPLIDSDRGPLLTALNLGGQPGLALHFRPRASDLPLRVAWPVLLLDAAAWLTGADEVARQATTGEPLVRGGLADGAALRLIGPDGAAVATARDGLARFPPPARVGLYRLEGPDGASLVGVNLLSEAESDLSMRPPPVVEATAAAQVAGRWPVTRPVLGLLALLLVAEWLVWRRRYGDG